jgi:hypothetical protein
MSDFLLKICLKIWLFINNILRSFDNIQNSGYSARKLTGCTAIMAGAYIFIYQLEPQYKLHALYAWQLTGLIALGIVTAEQIIRLKTETKTKES